MKTIRVLLQIIEGALFPLSGTALFVAFTMFTEELSATSPYWVRALPFLLFSVSLVYLWFFVHATLHPSSPKTRKLTFLFSGVFFVLTGMSMVILDIVYLFAKIFPSLLIGTITSIYPLDTLIYGIISDFFGLFLVYYGWKKADQVKGVVYAKPLSLGKRIVGKYVFGTLYLLVAMYFSSDVLLVFVTMDYSFKNIGVTLPFYFLMILPLFELALYEYVLRKASPLQEFVFVLRGIPLFLLGGIIFSVWGYFASSYNPTAIPESMTALFPQTICSSVNMGPIFLYLINILPPLVYLLNYLLLKRKQAKGRPQELDEKKKETRK